MSASSRCPLARCAWSARISAGRAQATPGPRWSPTASTPGPGSSGSSATARRAARQEEFPVILYCYGNSWSLLNGFFRRGCRESSPGSVTTQTGSSLHRSSTIYLYLSSYRIVCIRIWLAGYGETGWKPGHMEWHTYQWSSTATSTSQSTSPPTASPTSTTTSLQSTPRTLS